MIIHDGEYRRTNPSSEITSLGYSTPDGSDECNTSTQTIIPKQFVRSKVSKVKQLQIEKYPILTKPLEQVGKQMQVPGSFWE